MEKRTGLFELTPNNPILRFCGWVGDLVILNLLWLVCSLPLVTLGAATTAVQSVILKKLRKEPVTTVRGFFAAFKLNFKQATLLFIIYAALAADAWILLSLYCGGTPTLAAVSQNVFIAFACIAFLVLWSFTLLYAFPLLALLKLTLKECFKNALLLSFRHVFNTLLILVTAVALVLLLEQIYALAVVVIGVIFYVWTALVYKTLLPLLPKEATELQTPDEGETTNR